jgi:hypothetical protein
MRTGFFLKHCFSEQDKKKAGKLLASPPSRGVGWQFVWHEGLDCAESGIYQLRRDPVREFPVFEALTVAAAAERNNLFHVVRGDVAAADIAIIVVFTVKWADRIFKHKTSNLPVKKKPS